MKKYCVLDQAGGKKIYNQNKTLFTTEFSDYYRINFRKINDPNANIELDFPNLFSEGRCVLFEKVPKDYEYYIFIDNDIVFQKKQKLNGKLEWVKNSPDIPKIIADFFDEYHPMHGTFYRETDPIQQALPSEVIDEKDVLRIKGFDISTVYYHHSFATLVFPAIIHGFWSIFNFQQWVCSKLYPDKLTCFTAISIVNLNISNRTGSSYASHDIEWVHFMTSFKMLFKNIKHHKLSLINHSIKTLLMKLIKRIFYAIIKVKSNNQKGSWYNFLLLGEIINNKKYYLEKINEIANDNSFIKEYSDNSLIIIENEKVIYKTVSKKLQTASKDCLKKVIDTESALYKNRVSLERENLKYLKKIKFNQQT